MSATTTAEELREEVRRRYAESARAVTEGSGCGCGSGSCCDGETDASKFGEGLYDEGSAPSCLSWQGLLRSVVATPLQSPRSMRARQCSIWAPVAAST